MKTENANPVTPREIETNGGPIATLEGVRVRLKVAPQSPVTISSEFATHVCAELDWNNEDRQRARLIDADNEKLRRACTSAEDSLSLRKSDIEELEAELTQERETVAKLKAQLLDKRTALEQEVWLHAWRAYPSNGKDGPRAWADAALKHFRAVFPVSPDSRTAAPPEGGTPNPPRPVKPLCRQCWKECPPETVLKSPCCQAPLAWPAIRPGSPVTL